MYKPIRHLATIIMILVATSPLKSFAQQELYPNRPITMVVPFAAGNINDVLARIVAKAMSTELGQQVIIENRAGAAGIIGTQFVSNAKPDGHTILWGSSGPLVTHPFIYKKLPYSPQQTLIPVNAVATSPMMLVVSSSKPYKNIAEFIDYAKKNPGKVTFSSPGIGTASHLVGELFQISAGVKMLHVAYKDSSSLMGDLLSGRTDAVFDFTPVMTPHIKSGSLIGIGITAENRNRTFTDVPTLKEKGYNITLSPWNAIMAPTNTPPAIIKRLSEAAQLAAKSPEAIRFQQDFDTVSISHMGPDALRQFIVTESEVFRNLVAKTGISIDN